LRGAESPFPSVQHRWHDLVSARLLRICALLRTQYIDTIFVFRLESAIFFPLLGGDVVDEEVYSRGAVSVAPNIDQISVQRLDQCKVIPAKSNQSGIF